MHVGDLIVGCGQRAQHDPYRLRGAVAFINDMIAPRVIAQLLGELAQPTRRHARCRAAQSAIDLFSAQADGLGGCEQFGFLRTVVAACARGAAV